LTHTVYMYYTASVGCLTILSVIKGALSTSSTTIVWKSCKIRHAVIFNIAVSLYLDQIMWFLWTEFRLHDNVIDTTTTGRAQTEKTMIITRSSSSFICTCD